MMPLNPISAREIVHILILEELAGVHGGRAVALKGGVNLRLFFESVRYSEDIDLDGERSSSAAIRSTIKGIFQNRAFLGRLRELGIRGLDPGEGPNKDSPTTFRYKFGVVLPGGIRHPTKVEVSFRPPHPEDATKIEAVPARFCEEYGIPSMSVCRYALEAAARQKIDALVGRREVQARDVFDLYTLVGKGFGDDLLAFLARTTTRDTLESARERAFAITFSEYEGQVVEFLGTDARERYGTNGAWDEIRLKNCRDD